MFQLLLVPCPVDVPKPELLLIPPCIPMPTFMPLLKPMFVPCELLKLLLNWLDPPELLPSTVGPPIV